MVDPDFEGEVCEVPLVNKASQFWSTLKQEGARSTTGGRGVVS